MEIWKKKKRGLGKVIIRIEKHPDMLLLLISQKLTGIYWSFKVALSLYQPSAPTEEAATEVEEGDGTAAR